MAKLLLALAQTAAGDDRLTVLKMLREAAPGEADEVAQLFASEARLSLRFAHANVVGAFETGQIDGRRFLALEYLEGQSYRVVQTRAAELHGHAAAGSCTTARGLPLHEHLRILSQLARGLHYVHTLRDDDGEPLAIVHRDVSPQNVILTYAGKVKLIDFGIAQTRATATQTRVELIRGRLDYMAPEQLASAPLDRRADVFALGVMLWEAISGARFAGGREVSDFDKAQARIRGAEADIRDVCPVVPAPLARLLAHALALAPADRLPDAESFADAVDAHLAAVGAEPSEHSLSLLLHPMFEPERRKLQALIDRRRALAVVERGSLRDDATLRPSAGPVLQTANWTTAHDLTLQSGVHEIAPNGPASDDTAQTHTATQPKVEAQATLAPGGVREKRRLGPALLLLLGALTGASLAWVGPLASARPVQEGASRSGAREPLLRVTVRDLGLKERADTPASSAVSPVVAGLASQPAPLVDEPLQSIAEDEGSRVELTVAPSTTLRAPAPSEQPGAQSTGPRAKLLTGWRSTKAARARATAKRAIGPQPGQLARGSVSEVRPRPEATAPVPREAMPLRALVERNPYLR
jgi:eukaryotic-like serine/threonine-protein kinase